MKRTVRTFLAVEIDAAVRSRAAGLIKTLAAAGADVKWVEAKNLHFTMKFLDEVALNEIPRISAVVARAAATIEPFDLEVRGAGPSRMRPGRRPSGWARASAQEAMIALHARLGARA